MSQNVIKVFLAVCFCLLLTPVTAQESESKAIFTTLGDDLKSGDATKFSKWFAADLEMDVLGNAGICSKSQAKQMMKNFYASYTPKAFSVVHISGTLPMRYCIGTLLAGGERFRVTLYVKTVRDTHTVQQIRIEKD